MKNKLKQNIFALLVVAGAPFMSSATVFAKDTLFNLAEGSGDKILDRLTSLYDHWWFILLIAGLFILIFVKDQTAKGVGGGMAVGSIILKILVSRKDVVENTINDVVSTSRLFDNLADLSHATAHLIGNIPGVFGA